MNTKTDFDKLHAIQASTDHEWEVVRHFRQKYFFDRVPVIDPYTWTFKNAQHIHLVLYKGEKIIGYAHIQLWPENRAALRIIVIDEAYRNRGIGGQFLKICECLLLRHEVKMLHVQSSPEAYKFYCNHGYIQMPFNDPDDYGSDSQDIEIGKKLAGLEDRSREIS